MTHYMTLAEKPFHKIQSGQKIIESRLFDEKRQQITLGDTIIFNSNEGDARCTVRVEALLRYRSFSDLFDDFAPELFGGDSKENLLDGIFRFYSEADEKRYGVIGIAVELVG